MAQEGGALVRKAGWWWKEYQFKHTALYRWQTRTPTHFPLAVIDGHFKPLTSTSVSRKAKYAAASMLCTQVQIWDEFDSGNLVFILLKWINSFNFITINICLQNTWKYSKTAEARWLTKLAASLVPVSQTKGVAPFAFNYLDNFNL